MGLFFMSMYAEIMAVCLVPHLISPTAKSLWLRLLISWILIEGLVKIAALGLFSFVAGIVL